MRCTILFAIFLTLATHTLAAEAAKGVSELQGRWKLSAVEVNEREAELPGDLPVWEIKDARCFMVRRSWQPSRSTAA